jgi:hypothetical protein
MAVIAEPVQVTSSMRPLAEVPGWKSGIVTLRPIKRFGVPMIEFVTVMLLNRAVPSLEL